MRKEIPKIIHYCWFGGKPLPENARKCIASWRKFLPDYEIWEWNETNFDIDKCPSYAKDAYAAKKYAFVSDFARLKILYEHGGVYFDTDVELIKPIDDIIAKGSFMGCESGGVNPGLGCAALSGLPIFEALLKLYTSLSFYREDGSFNQTTIVAHVTSILKSYGLKETENIQKCAGIWIYPEEYFCPLNYETRWLNVTDKTRSIHHYAATWITFNQRMFKSIEHIAGRKCAKFISTFLRKIHLLK